jgi:CHAT domain-containing protein
MDEQRIQAYIDLIGKLLSCPEGKEGEILQAHQELLDPGLVQAMVVVAAQLQQQGNETNAARLQNLAVQLAEAMGLTTTDQPETSQPSQDSRQFFIEILQCMEQNQFAAQPVYQFFAANQARLNADLLNAIPATASVLLANAPKEQHKYIAAVIGTFANLIQQFPLGQRMINMELAIAAYQESLTVMTQSAMPVDWATTMMNLATAYYSRIRGDKAENIESAIAAYQESLTVRTQSAMPVDWATTMMNLATAYYSRIRGDKAENIESAIAAYQESLTVRTQSAMPVDWATTMMNLATAYYSRIRGDKAENIESAIAAYQESLTVRTQSAMPVEWATTMMNLANAYYSRIRGDKAENIESAIAAYQESLTIFKPDLLPDDCRRTARLLGNLYADNQRWAEAVAPYEQALEAAEILYQATLFRSSQEAELSATNDLFRRAAYAQAQTGNLKQAVVTAEVGRARGLSETLERDRADLSELETTAPALYQQYQQAVDALRQLEAEERSASSPAAENHPALSQAELRQRAETVRQQLKDAITAIRQHPGNEDFLDQPSFKDIAAAVQPDQPLVYLLPTANGSLALIVSQSAASDPVEIASIWLDTLTDTSLQELLAGPGEDLGGWFGAYINRNTDLKTWFQTIDQVTHQLWDLLMEPVVTHLKNLSVAQAILIPTGFLSFLPLHAAWTEDPSTPSGKRYAFDEIQLTYAPNARSLAVAQAIAQQVRSDTMLAIDEPKHRVKDKNDIYRDLSPLPNSTREVQAAISTFQNAQVLPHQQATKEAVLAALPKANVLHCSCHGSANLAEPLKSGLAMTGDGEAAILTLNDLLSLKLQERETGGIRLAVLSACETGLSGTQLPDEVVSLPAGLLQVGVAGVVASLWSVDDLSTMLLLSKFYELWRTENKDPSEALRQAQIWLRDSTAGDIANSRGLYTPTPDEHFYAHPFYWAAFNYTGI